MSEALKELLALVEKAEGPDREIDGDIGVLFFGGSVEWKQANFTMDNYPVILRESANHIGGRAFEAVPFYTASLDAAIALVVAVFPDWRWRTESVHNGYSWAFIHRLDSSLEPGAQYVDHRGAAKTPALALIVALLKAKLSALHQGEQGNG